MITVYTQPDCRPCKRVIEKLEEAGVEIDIVDLTKDMAAKDFVQRAYQAKSTPVVVDDVTGEVIVGYQPDRIKKMILDHTLDTEQIHDFVYEGEEE
jgi:glutaredoxin-like protein NrdH